ncbi:3-dehydroquinate synthase [Flavobacteriales bacterium]|nr:3-dehydroquinate synthase [Flavobacteriales bacterium]MDB9910076.1 3-dehydroquinate synthase [Flavobacteriales bacterium]
MKEIKAIDYSIWIGENSLSKLDISTYSKVAILVDENTMRDCLFKLPQIENALIIEIKSGEEYKNISTCNFIWEQLTINNFDRNALLINLGGGVIGDMGGFCATTYKRGLEFIHIPTTLLAMVDASVGGKLGIDFKGFKNQIGLFNNPKAVLISSEFLETLAESELKSGFAEVVKHALISDNSLWLKLKNTPFTDLDWEDIIDTSVQIKNKIVLADPFEKGERKKLNFGHTFGHAIESYYLEKRIPISHGEAVFMGMILETKISDLSETEKNEIKNYILSDFSLPCTPKKSNLHKFLINDKKNQNGKINFTLLNGIGNCSFDNLFSLDEL